MRCGQIRMVGKEEKKMATGGGVAGQLEPTALPPWPGLSGLGQAWPGQAPKYASIACLPACLHPPFLPPPIWLGCLLLSGSC